MAAISDQFGRVLRKRYRLDSALGTGGSARVYLARDLDLERDVAIKLLHPGLANDTFFFRRFQTEARTAAALNHPNIVHVYDWGEDEGEPFLVLEHLAGGSVRSLLNRRSLSLGEVAKVGGQAARGLEYAHQRGVVHRDIKPANLLFDEVGVVHVADFGIARVLADAPWSEPSGVVLGTARYVSPEQAVGATLTDRSDVYSLALVCWEALVGTARFGSETTYGTLMSRVGDPSLPPVSELGPLGPILERASAGDPSRRPDAGTFAAEFERIAATLPESGEVTLAIPTTISAPREMIEPRFDLVDDTDATTGTDTASGPRRNRRHRTPATGTNRRRWRRWVVGAVVAVVLLAGGGVAYVEVVLYGRTVPNLRGLSLPAAVRLATKDGIAVARHVDAYSATVPAGDVVAQSLAPGRNVKSGTRIDLVVSRGHQPVTVPTVVGESGRTAIDRLRAAHFVVKVRRIFNETAAVGSVISATPASVSVPFGSTVSIDLSHGPKPRTVPNLAGMSLADAQHTLSALRLVPQTSTAYSDTVASGTVIATQPPANTTGVAVGTNVDITVSKGPRLIAIPTVDGETIAAAIAALQAAGLTVNEQIGPPFATKATTTQPAPGTEVRPGSDVTLYVA